MRTQGELGLRESGDASAQRDRPHSGCTVKELNLAGRRRSCRRNCYRKGDCLPIVRGVETRAQSAVGDKSLRGVGQHDQQAFNAVTDDPAARNEEVRHITAGQISNRD